MIEIEEAIKYLRHFHCLCNEHCNKKCIRGNSQCAYQMAISALEKQIPIKPTAYNSVPHHRCPNCKSAVRIYCTDPYDKFCHHCGQALDWS